MLCLKKKVNKPLCLHKMSIKGTPWKGKSLPLLLPHHKGKGKVETEAQGSRP